MNDEPPSFGDLPRSPRSDRPPLEAEVEASERFVSAALEELARLGPRREDRDLVNEILLATVSAPRSVRRAASPPEDRRTWLAASVLVAAMVALIVAVLSQVPFRRAADPDASMRFVVSYPLGSDTVPAAGAEGAEPGPGVRPVLPPRAYDGSVPLVVTATAVPGGASEILIRDTSLELVETLSPTVIDFSRRRSLSDRFHIDADRSVRNENELAYVGNVRLRHESFTLEADRVWLETGDPSAEEPEAIWAAENARLRFHDLGAGVPLREAEALALRFDSLSGRMLLEGVRRLETAEGEILALEAGAKLRLTRGAYQWQPVGEAEVEEVRAASPRGR